MNNRVQEGVLRVREDPRAWSKGNISRRMLSTPESSGPTTMMKTRHDREVEQRRCSCIVWIRISDEGRKELHVRKKMSRLETRSSCDLSLIGLLKWKGTICTSRCKQETWWWQSVYILFCQDHCRPENIRKQWYGVWGGWTVCPCMQLCLLETA